MIASFCAVAIALWPSLSLYDARTDSSPHDAPWYWALVGTGGTVTPPNGTAKVTLDTTADPAVQRGWLNVSPVALVPARAADAVFDLRVVSETHLSTDRAGLSVIVLGADKKGIELSFWEDRVWAQNDNPLFTHGEEALVDAKAIGTGVAGLRRYRLTFNGSAYGLSVDGTLVLTGPKRDYTAFNGLPDPYEIPNVLWVGDDTRSASSRFEFSWFEVRLGPGLNGPGIRTIWP